MRAEKCSLRSHGRAWPARRHLQFSTQRIHAKLLSRLLLENPLSARTRRVGWQPGRSGEKSNEFSHGNRRSLAKFDEMRANLRTSEKLQNLRRVFCAICTEAFNSGVCRRPHFSALVRLSSAGTRAANGTLNCRICRRRAAQNYSALPTNLLSFL